MLDIKFIRKNAELVRSKLSARGEDLDLEKLLDLDAKRRELISESEELKGKRNRVSKEIGRLKREGKETSDIQAEVRELGTRINDLDEERLQVEEQLNGRLLLIPNLPHESTPLGEDESDNPVVRVVGQKPEAKEHLKPHWELGKELGLFDFERGAKISGSGFPLYVGLGARLERALIQLMLDIQVGERGYTEISPPFLVNAAAMTGTGQLPKFEDDMYSTGSDGFYLVPTAEVPITNLVRDEILEDGLPLKYVAYTPCFRREAGAAGSLTRGLNRVHQFDKVEIVRIVKPDDSYEQLELLLKDAELVLQRLGIHYRVIELCSGDLGFGAAKCYDIEIWAPGQESWLEVSSCSNFEDFQARRANIRYRSESGRPELVHTLNGSAVALPRLVVALLESNQQPDGSVVLPEALRPYMNGLDKLERDSS